MIVVKVGGSLFDHPALGAGLRVFVESLAPNDVLLVPGGGPVADAVRELDRVHGLGEEASHWLALRALSVTAALMNQLIAGGDELVLAPKGPQIIAQGASPGSATPNTRSPEGATQPPCVAPSGPRQGSPRILDPFAFALEDESRPDALPHTWSVTTDSIAARVASVYRAERLILLKSLDIPPNTPWPEAAANGWVDAHFPQVAVGLECPVEIINFRRKLSARA